MSVEFGNLEEVTKWILEWDPSWGQIETTMRIRSFAGEGTRIYCKDHAKNRYFVNPTEKNSKLTKNRIEKALSVSCKQPTTSYSTLF